MYFVSLGYDCSPAAALKGLEMRQWSLPLDWVETKGNTLYKVLLDDFAHYHKNIKLTNNKKRIVDYYGVEFPHDYPTIGGDDTEITEDWEKYSDVVDKKYQRRIERFRNIFLESGDKTVMVLFRGALHYAKTLKLILNSRYPNSKIIFIIATYEVGDTCILENHIIGCNPERNGGWNEPSIWKEGIDVAFSLETNDISQKCT